LRHETHAQTTVKDGGFSELCFRSTTSVFGGGPKHPEEAPQWAKGLFGRAQAAFNMIEVIALDFAGRPLLGASQTRGA
jgi:hypothetical protein